MSDHDTHELSNDHAQISVNTDVDLLFPIGVHPAVRIPHLSIFAPDLRQPDMADNRGYGEGFGD